MLIAQVVPGTVVLRVTAQLFRERFTNLATLGRHFFAELLDFGVGHRSFVPRTPCHASNPPMNRSRFSDKESFLGALLMALLVFVLGRRTTW